MTGFTKGETAMNNNLLAIVKQIVDQHGEGILGDSARLKPLFADYAKNEVKEDRVAFGRCLEHGAYQELKKTRTADERQRVKAVMFKPEQQAFSPQSQAKVQNGILKFLKDNDILGKIYIVLFILTLVLATLTRQYHFLPDGVWLDVIGIIVAAPLAIGLIFIVFVIPIGWIINKVKGAKE
jgi:hypothetical protein